MNNKIPTWYVILLIIATICLTIYSIINTTLDYKNKHTEILTYRAYTNPVMEIHYELPVYEDNVEYVEPIMIRCTCYCNHGITKSGQHTRQGIVAGRKEWLGYTAVLYQVNEDGSIGDFIGYYEFTDTGTGIDTDGDGYGDSIINGTSIDVWQPTYQDCSDWVRQYGDYVYMQLLEGVG